MIPNIFISSTIADLNHLRDSIRDQISDLGFNPIMSEYGDIGYLPSSSAEDSCYIALKDCHIAIFIIGKRYGSLSNDGLSITHKEFRTTKDKGIPIIFLINEEVQSFKKIYEANKENSETLNLPGMDSPSKLFSFVDEFTSSNSNNGYLTYNNVQSAKLNLKKQLAHIFADLLTKEFDQTRNEIKDILSEITTLRHMLIKDEQDVARKFSVAFRFLLNEENRYLKDVTEVVAGSLEEGLPTLLKQAKLSEFLEHYNVDFKIFDSKILHEKYGLLSASEDFHKKGIKSIYYGSLPHKTLKTKAAFGKKAEYDLQPISDEDNSIIYVVGEKLFYTNKNGEILIEEMFLRLKNITQ
ncbi:DUF4062 domain-containing protein [Algoriella sp.]|uniref:DUF4062 domain-containing protein n=1 Tax=Algoriella sp. TaxID=1872434 RepID=UPI002FC81BD0